MLEDWLGGKGAGFCVCLCNATLIREDSAVCWALCHGFQGILSLTISLSISHSSSISLSSFVHLSLPLLSYHIANAYNNTDKMAILPTVNLLPKGTKMFSLPYSMFQLLMDVETLLITPTTPHLRLWTAKLYPLTLFFSFSANLDYLHYGTLL